MDSESPEDETDAVSVGYVLVSLSKYTGGNQCMRSHMHDILKISNTVGYLDILLAMTCSLQRKGTKDVLHPEQKVTDRPDLLACIFHVKL